MALPLIYPERERDREREEEEHYVMRRRLHLNGGCCNYRFSIICCYCEDYSADFNVRAKTKAASQKCNNNLTVQKEFLDIMSW